MNQLKEMLEAYRNGERGLPTYAELADIEARHAATVDSLKAIERKMSEMYSLSNEIGVNDADGFYLGFSHDVIKQAKEALAYQ